MTQDEAKKAINSGVIAALIVAGLTTVVTLIAMATSADDEALAYFNDASIIVDILIILVLAFFLWKKSRTAAILLLTYYILAKVITMIEAGSPRGSFLTLVFIWFFGKAVWGTFIWHKLKKLENPELYKKKNMSKWWYVPIGIFSGVFILLIGFGIASTVGVVPATLIQSGDELPKAQEAQLREQGLLQSDEFVRYYYSTALFNIASDGSVLTNKRLITYWTLDEKRDVYAIDLDQIESIELNTEGSAIEDAAYNIYPYEPDPNYMTIWLSIESDRHLDMVKAIEKEALKNAEARADVKLDEE